MNGDSLNLRTSRREFLANGGVLSAAGVIGPSLRLLLGAASYFEDPTTPEYTVRIRASAVDIGNKHIVSAVTYNDQFPGPLLRFKEGQPVRVEIHNDTDTPEQLHWHGQFVSPDVDGTVGEGTPFIPAHWGTLEKFSRRKSRSKSIVSVLVLLCPTITSVK